MTIRGADLSGLSCREIPVKRSDLEPGTFRASLARQRSGPAAIQPRGWVLRSYFGNFECLLDGLEMRLASQRIEQRVGLQRQLACPKPAFMNDGDGSGSDVLRETRGSVSVRP